jgi:hypothetical protein
VHDVLCRPPDKDGTPPRRAEKRVGRQEFHQRQVILQYGTVVCTPQRKGSDRSSGSQAAVNRSSGLERAPGWPYAIRCVTVRPADCATAGSALGFRQSSPADPLAVQAATRLHGAPAPCPTRLPYLTWLCGPHTGRKCFDGAMPAWFREAGSGRRSQAPLNRSCSGIGERGRYCHRFLRNPVLV